MDELAISVPEAARRLGISRNSAYRAVSKGDIPSTRIGNRIVVPLKWLEERLKPASRESEGEWWK